MALTKVKIIDKIEILEDGVVQVREATRVFDDDGSLLAETYHRTLLTPGADTTGVPQRLARICNIVWDAKTVSEYAAKQALLSKSTK